MKKQYILAAILGLAGFGAGVLPLAAQERWSAEQVRTRIMDSCMVSLSREVSQTTPIYPACQCYATGLVKVMEERDFADYTRTQQVSSRLTPAAKEIYAQCRSKNKL